MIILNTYSPYSSRQGRMGKLPTFEYNTYSPYSSRQGRMGTHIYVLGLSLMIHPWDIQHRFSVRRVRPNTSKASHQCLSVLVHRKQSKRATPLKCSSLASQEEEEPIGPVLIIPGARASFGIPRQGRTMCACTTGAECAQSVLQRAWVTPAAGALMLDASACDVKGNKLEPFSRILSLKTSLECLYPRTTSFVRAFVSGSSS